jgi:hypothetical protein
MCSTPLAAPFLRESPPGGALTGGDTRIWLARRPSRHWSTAPPGGWPRPLVPLSFARPIAAELLWRYAGPSGHSTLFFSIAKWRYALWALRYAARRSSLRHITNTVKLVCLDGCLSTFFLFPDGGPKNFEISPAVGQRFCLIKARPVNTVPIRPIRVTVRAGWNESRAGSKSGLQYGARGRTNRGKRNCF